MTHPISTVTHRYGRGKDSIDSKDELSSYQRRDCSNRADQFHKDTNKPEESHKNNETEAKEQSSTVNKLQAAMDARNTRRHR